MVERYFGTENYSISWQLYEKGEREIYSAGVTLFTGTTEIVETTFVYSFVIILCAVY